MTSRFLVKQNLRFFEFFYPYTAREGVFVCGKSGETGWLRAGQSSAGMDNRIFSGGGRD
jgi:hypothetical protein